LARRTNIRSPRNTQTSARFRKPYINTQDYPDFMRVVPAQYIYKQYPTLPHSLYKKPYADYSIDYQGMELTWNQSPIVIDWRPSWPTDVLDVPDVYVPSVETGEAPAPAPTQYILYTDGGSVSADIYRYYEPTWDDAHDTAAGEGVETWDDLAIQAYQHSAGKFSIFRAFFRLDLSGVSGTVNSVELREPTDNGFTVSIQQGTHGDSFTTGDYNAFTDSYFALMSWDASASASRAVFNTAGVNYIQSCLGGYAYFCARDYDYDYLDVEPPYDPYDEHKGVIHTGSDVGNDCYFIITMQT